MEIIEKLIADIDRTKGLSTYLNREYCIEILLKANKEIEKQLSLSAVSQQRELLTALKECRGWMINKGVNVESEFFKKMDKAINCC